MLRPARAMAPYSAKIHDAYLCFYSETTLRSQSSRQKVEAMKWNASCVIAKRALAVYAVRVLHNSFTHCACVHGLNLR